MPFFRSALTAISLAAASSAYAQMPGMDMSQPRTLIDSILQHTSSGTTVEPRSTPMPMLMRSVDGWTLMLHGAGFAADIQQHAGSERGGDKLFSTNWIMPMAQRRLGRGELTLRGMLSLEPATVTGRFYPELFQQGETAYGKPIVDGQHPHDFAMELGALYDIRIGKSAMLSLYAAPVGDPAIGPTAYPHRESASEDPIAALGHHQQDSTHIAFNVVTAGLTYRSVRLEASGFHGAEPSEARWHFQPSPNGTTPDSYSGRVTWAPTANISAQYSISGAARRRDAPDRFRHVQPAAGHPSRHHLHARNDDVHSSEGQLVHNPALGAGQSASQQPARQLLPAGIALHPEPQLHMDPR
jgi:hypothetical protein